MAAGRTDRQTCLIVRCRSSSGSALPTVSPSLTPLLYELLEHAQGVQVQTLTATVPSRARATPLLPTFGPPGAIRRSSDDLARGSGDPLWISGRGPLRAGRTEARC